MMRAREFLRRKKEILNKPGHSRAKGEAIAELKREYEGNDPDRFDEALTWAEIEAEWGYGDDWGNNWRYNWVIPPEDTDEKEGEDESESEDETEGEDSESDDGSEGDKWKRTNI